MTLVNAETGELVAHSLAECESVIERGLTTFVEVGQALMEIRDGRLYRETHDDFDTYCRERWGWQRRRADQIIGAAEVVDGLGTTVPSPANEAQARPLTKLPTPEERREAWGEANRRAAEEERPVTARDVEDAVADLAPPPAPKPPPPALTEEEQRERDLAVANESDARRLRQILASWDSLDSLQTNPRRGRILALLTKEQRQDVLAIEGRLRRA